MNTAKVINLPVGGSAASRADILWLIGVNPQIEEKCVLKPGKRPGGWNADVSARTLDRAVELVRQCCDELGLEV